MDTARAARELEAANTAYMAKHQLGAVFEHLLREVVKAKPSDPRAYLVELLSSKVGCGI